MSFQNQYQNEINEIKPDGYTKGKIRAALKETPHTPHKKRGFPLVRGLAVSLCGILLVASVFLFRKEKPVTHIMSESIPAKVASSYSNLYQTVKPLVSSNKKLFGRPYADEEEFVTYGAAEADTGAEPKAVNDSAALLAKNSTTDDFSETTKQVEGVEEADIVKTDGTYLYRLAQNYKDFTFSLIVVDTRGETPKVIADVALDTKKDCHYETMYITDNRLILLGRDYSDYTSAKTLIAFYDITDRAKPSLVKENMQCGSMHDSRMIGDTLYLISDHSIGGNIDEGDPRTYCPVTWNGTEESVVPADSICVYGNCTSPVYTVVCGYAAKDGALLDTKSVLRGSYAVYCNTETLLTAGYEKDGKTQLVRFMLAENAITVKANGEVPGSLLNQFSMDEYAGYFRFVTTSMDKNTWKTVNLLTVLDSDLKPAGKIENIAPGERVYSVRFMGNTGYFVTFRQVDPLFSVDLSDPHNPKIIGSLKIPGFSDYLFPYGEGKLLGIGKNADEKTGMAGMMKLSLFDISNPANVTEAFKTDVKSFYSEALYNHKACLTDAGRNLIGFCGSYEDFSYYLYTLKEDGFHLLAEIPLTEKENCRGLYIGNTFYIVGAESLLYFDLDAPQEVKTLFFR